MHTTYGIFPVPIYCNDLGRGFTVEEMDAMEAYATDCQVGISGNNMSNSASVLDNPVLKDLKAFVEQNIAAYLAEVEAPSDNVSAYITHSFLNFIDKGQGHMRHAHFNSFISGVLYINANRDTDRIHFYREKYSYFVRAAARIERLNSIAKLPELVVARATGEHWEFINVKYGRLAATNVSTATTSVSKALAALGLISEQVVNSGFLQEVNHEEVELILNFLESPGVRIVKVLGEYGFATFGPNSQLARISNYDLTNA